LNISADYVIISTAFNVQIMSLEVNIHEAQTLILRELLFRPTAGYAQLQKPTGLTSDHFNFHISRLVELGLVEKAGRGLYKLSLGGKEYANKLDTASNTIERQPKLAVMLAISREGNGKEQFLIQERVKNPNYGFFGFPTGKVRWGETIIDTANRELFEETKLKANFEVAGIYHEHVRLQETHKLMEDKLFFICRGRNVRGVLQTEFEGGKNQWMTLDELQKKDKKFKSLEFELKIIKRDTWLIEETTWYSKDKF
jgi:ADP-ribose pyrophosphatase YjhB (NUDIX family)